MNPIGYLFIDESDGLQGQVLIKPQFLEDMWLVRVDVIDDWISQLKTMKKNAIELNNEDEQ